MGTYQLGPETPRPFSVLSENYLRFLTCPQAPLRPEERYSFGPLYEKRLVSLIEKYCDLAIDERVCYVGDEKGSLAPVIEQLLCLVYPVTSVVPGYIHYEESSDHRVIPVRVENVGAEPHFDQLPAKPLYDKIIIKDSIAYVNSLPRFIAGVTKVLSELGKILIIHRDASMTTLPIWWEAKNRLERHEQPYAQLLDGLAKCNLNVYWEVECLPVVMPKRKWLAMIKDKFPPIMQIVSDFEVKMGLREVTEGILKYEGETVEFTDRLLIVVASKHIGIGRPPLAQRYSTMNHIDLSSAGPKLTYTMEMTQQIKKIIQDKKNVNNKFRGEATKSRYNQ